MLKEGGRVKHSKEREIDTMRQMQRDRAAAEPRRVRAALSSLEDSVQLLSIKGPNPD